MGQKDLIKLVVAVVLLVAGGWLIVTSSSGQNRTSGQVPDNYYYYDVDSGELFSGPTDAIGSISAPSGGEGVRAYVYTCGTCTEDELVVGYLQRLSDQAVKASQEARTADEENQQALFTVIQQGTYVAAKPESGGKPNWVSTAVPAGRDLMQSFQSICKGQLAKLCTPDQTK